MKRIAQNLKCQVCKMLPLDSFFANCKIAIGDLNNRNIKIKQFSKISVLAIHNHFHYFIQNSLPTVALFSVTTDWNQSFGVCIRLIVFKYRFPQLMGMLGFFFNAEPLYLVLWEKGCCLLMCRTLGVWMLWPKYFYWNCCSGNKVFGVLF